MLAKSPANSPIAHSAANEALDQVQSSPGTADNPIIVDDTSIPTGSKPEKVSGCPDLKVGEHNGGRGEHDPLTQPSKVTAKLSAFKTLPGHPFRATLVEKESKDNHVSEDDSTLEDEPGSARSTPTRSKSASCPHCGAQIDGHLVDKTLDYDLDAAFKVCRAHKISEARRWWEKESYPDIDWQGIEARGKEHFALVRDILARRRSSVAIARLERGHNEPGHSSLLGSPSQKPHNLTTGYYGPRGTHTLEKLVSDNMRTEIEDFVRSDPIGQVLTHAGVIQAIIIPEIMLRFVQEDMKCSEQRAVRILDNSTAVGDVLHPDPADSESHIRGTPVRASSKRKRGCSPEALVSQKRVRKH